MKTLELLKQVTQRELTPEEETQFLTELSAAYHRDEVSSSSQAVRRVAEKISAQMKTN